MLKTTQRLARAAPQITRSFVANPAEGWSMLREKVDRYFELRRPRCPYQVDHDWEQRLHDRLGVPGRATRQRSSGTCGPIPCSHLRRRESPWAVARLVAGGGMAIREWYVPSGASPDICDLPTLSRRVWPAASLRGSSLMRSSSTEPATYGALTYQCNKRIFKTRLGRPFPTVCAIAGPLLKDQADNTFHHCSPSLGKSICSSTTAAIPVSRFASKWTVRGRHCDRVAQS